MKNIIALLCFLNSFCFLSFAQDKKIARLEVDAGNYDRLHTLVSANLKGLDIDLANRSLVLYELQNQQERRVITQLDFTDGAKLWWKLSDPLSAGTTREYILKLEDHPYKNTDPKVQVIKDKGNLRVSFEGKNVLKYHFNPPPLPDGVPEIYSRAGFIHPIWSPKGEVITRIQPPDHYHHYGLWNPWTHTEFKGKTIDFWNLLLGQGTVKPVSIISVSSNNLFGGFQVLHDHIDLNGLTTTGAEVALKEVWDVRVWNVREDGWVIDFTSNLNCATDSVFKITEYRYQGFGLRATEKWDDKTATLLTSEGKNKGDGNSTRARWCDINGVSDFGTSGILFITHPTNYNYPEPIRIWPTGSNNGKENVFFNFNPAMDRDWKLEPGKDYQLKYRMYVYDGKIDKVNAEKLWADFAYPPSVTIEIIQ